MNPVLILLAMLADLIRESLPDMVERLPATTVQKFRDALQAIEQEQATPSVGGGLEFPAGHDFEPSLPPFVTDLLDLLKTDLQGRAERDNTNSAIATRTAVAMEKLADVNERMAQAMTAATKAA